MNGNRTHPLAGLLGPLAGYYQGRQRKGESDRRVAEAMRRARMEEEELGFRRAESQRRDVEFAREGEKYGALERLRGRLGEREAGPLTRPEALEYSTYGLDVPEDYVEPLPLEQDPVWRRRKAEMEFLAGQGYYKKTPPASAMPPDAYKRAQARWKADYENWKAQNVTGQFGGVGPEAPQPPEFDDYLREEMQRPGAYTPFPESPGLSPLSGLSGDLGADMGMPGPAYAGLDMGFEEPAPSDTGPRMPTPPQSFPDEGFPSAEPSRMVLEGVRQRDPSAASWVEELVEQWGGGDWSADTLEEVRDQLAQDPMFPDPAAKERILAILDEMIGAGAF